MLYSAKDLEKIHKTRLEIPERYRDLMYKYVFRKYNDQTAEEYARHGFSRRLETMVRCIDSIFETLPPEQVEIPNHDDVTDAVINLQAFIFNLFGCTDNLARIWVHERKPKRADGSPIPPGWIGLREKNTFVRCTFSTEFQEYLKGLNGWFENLENFRHALAHRIPLYIPPSTVPGDKVAACFGLNARMWEAFNRGDVAEYERLSAEIDAAAVFYPLITHSFEEKANFVWFHGQLLADFDTIEELGHKMLEELDR